MANKKSYIFINTLVLVVITFVAISALAVVNQITAEPIAKADLKQKAQAYTAVYPDASEFAEIEGLEAMLEESPALFEKNGFGGCTVTDILAVKSDDGSIDGYIIAATSPNAYGGEIEIAIGIKDGKLTGFTTIKNNETAGLGSKCNDPEFTKQFIGKLAAILSYTKSGSASDTEVDAISGATITTNAVTQAVNAAIIFYQQNFGGGVQENEGPDLTEFYKAAYPNATKFTDVENADTLLEDSQKLLADYGLNDCTVEDVKSVNDGEGYVISTTGIGFAKANPIQIVIGIKDGVITGYSVVNHMETEGYGAVCDDEGFASQFTGKPVVIMVSKVGATADNEIDAISGATFTTNGVKNAVNSAVVFYQTNFGNGDIDEQAIAQSNSVDATAGATH